MVPHSDDETTEVQLSDLFDVLSHAYRRRILAALFDHNPRDEEEFDPDAIADADDDVELLRTELYHAHLPRLVEEGFVEWDPETGSLERGPRFEDIAPLLQLMADHEDDLPDDWP